MCFSTVMKFGDKLVSISYIVEFNRFFFHFTFYVTEKNVSSFTETLSVNVVGVNVSRVGKFLFLSQLAIDFLLFRCFLFNHNIKKHAIHE